MKNSKVDPLLPTNHVGNYQFRAYFNGNYELNEIMGRYFVNDLASWEFNDNYWPAYINDSKILTLKLAEDKAGNLSVEITKDGEAYQNYTIEVINGTCSIPLPTNHIGKFTIATKFVGNCEVLPHEETYEVESEYYISVSNNYPSYNSGAFVSVELPEDGVGTLTLEIKYNENDNYTFYESAELEYGQALIELPTNRVGKLYYNAFYKGNYELYNSTDIILVSPDYCLKNNVLKLIADEKLNGTFSVTDGDSYNVAVKVKNGQASIDLTKYRKNINEEKCLTLSFTSYDDEKYEMGDEYVKPIYDIKIVSKDITIYYGDSKSFKAKIYRNDKPVGKGEYVAIKIGSTNYKVKTDKNGIVKVRIKQTPLNTKLQSNIKEKHRRTN